MPRSLSSYTGKMSYLNKQPRHQGAGVLQDIDEPENLQGEGVVALSPEHMRIKGQLQGQGVGRQRVNEPLFSRASNVKQDIPRSDDGRIPRVSTYGTVRTTPLIHDTDQKGQGAEDFLPGDALKMKLIRKMVCARKSRRDSARGRLSKTSPKKNNASLGKKKSSGRALKKISNQSAVMMFPILFKKIDPQGAQILNDPDKKKKAMSALNTLLNQRVKQPKADAATAEKIASVFAELFEKMGHDVPGNAEKVLKNEILSGLFRLETGTFAGSGKNKAFWKAFGKSFKATLKVGLPIAALIAPELAPVALAAELLL